MKREIRAVSKLLLAFISASFLASYDSSNSNLNISAALAISVCLFVALSMWFLSLQKRPNSEIDRSISLSGAFWPMKRYPFQYWALVSVVMILGGCSSILKVIVLHHGNVGYGMTFLSSGIAVALATALHHRIK